MTRVDFYLLSASSGNAVMTACRLCEKAATAGLRIFVRTTDAGLADEIDGALWSFRQGGFVAHERLSGAVIDNPQPPVLIGAAAPPETHRAILINMGGDVPAWFSSFDRVLEVVPEDPAQRAASRERFRFYKDRGYDINTFEQNTAGGWQQRPTA